MVVNNYFEKIVKSWHYKTFHEKEVQWSLVLQIISTAKRRIKAKNIVEFKTKKHYVLGKIEKGKLKIINAKKLK